MPDEATFAAFGELPDDEPVIMLNLLEYADVPKILAIVDAVLQPRQPMAPEELVELSELPLSLQLGFRAISAKSRHFQVSANHVFFRL